MKPGAFASYTLASALLLLTCASVAQPQSSGGGGPQERPAVKLSVRFLVHAGAAPAYYPLADDGSGMGAVIKDFRRLPPSPWSKYPQIETLTMMLARDGARARVSIFIPSETEGYPQSGKVAECLLAEGAECATTQLLAYGVEPFRLSAVRRVESKLSPPRVINHTGGVNVTSVEVREEGPSFELTLRNVSGKAIRAVEIEERRGWQSKGAPPRYEWKKMAPVKPEGEWKVSVEFGWNGKAEQGAHAVEPPDLILIKAILFADGSHEGNSFFAVRAAAITEGRKVQLARVVEILREAGDRPVIDAREAARELAATAEALERTADWASVVELAGRFNLSWGSVLDDVKSGMEEGMELERAGAVNVFRGTAAAAPAGADGRAFSAWTKLWREAYERALAAM